MTIEKGPIGLDIENIETNIETKEEEKMTEENLNECFFKAVEALEKMVDNEGYIEGWVERSLASLWETADFLRNERVKKRIEKIFSGKKPRLMKGSRYTFCHND